MTSYLPELPVGEIKSQVNGSQERILALVPERQQPESFCDTACDWRGTFADGVIALLGKK